MSTSAIYSIINTVNNMFYVGRSINVEKRLKQHKWDLQANRHTNPKLQNSYNKYGECSFIFVIDCVVPAERLVEFEQIAIDEGISSGKCFNINTNAAHGGVIGRVWTAEQIENIKRGQQTSLLFARTSLANQTEEDREYALSLARSPVSRAKASATRKTKEYAPSEKTKAYQENILQEAVARTLEAIYWVMETREPMRVANKKFKINQRMWAKVIPIWEATTNIKFDLPNRACGTNNHKVKKAFGVTSPLGTFLSVAEASTITGLGKSTIIYRCKHNVKGWAYTTNSSQD